MRRIRIAGLCLVAVFAFGAMVASAAQARETRTEYGRCVAQKHGNYTESGCKTVAMKKGVADHKGHYEWSEELPTCVAKKHGEYTNETCTDKSAKAHKGKYEKEPGAKITTSSGPSAIEAYRRIEEGERGWHELPFNNEGERVRQEGPGAVVKCAASTGTGEINKPTERVYGRPAIKETITFTGCKSEGKPCENVAPETIEITKIKNELEWSESLDKLGAFVNNSVNTEPTVAFKCGAVTVEWEELTSATAEVTPGVTPVVDRFETQVPTGDEPKTEGVQKIGPGPGWEDEAVGDRMRIVRYGPGVPEGYEAGEAGLQSEQKITGDAGLEVRVPGQ